MKLPSLPLRVRMLGAALILSAATMPAMALPMMGMQVEDLIAMSAEFKKSLNLNANQNTLWQQTETRTKQLIRDRLSRRERLQEATKAALDGNNVELRELAPAIDAESATSAAEEKQLREWWLTVNDALNESQRKLVAVFIGEQLMRAADNGSRPATHERDDSGDHKSGGRHKGGGAGGNSVSIPGL